MGCYLSTRLPDTGKVSPLSILLQATSLSGALLRMQLPAGRSGCHCNVIRFHFWCSGHRPPSSFLFDGRTAAAIPCIVGTAGKRGVRMGQWRCVIIADRGWPPLQLRLRTRYKSQCVANRTSSPCQASSLSSKLPSLSRRVSIPPTEIWNLNYFRPSLLRRPFYPNPQRRHVQPPQCVCSNSSQASHWPVWLHLRHSSPSLNLSMPRETI